MLHVAILTLALASGDCPECQREAWGQLSPPLGQYDPSLPGSRVLVPPPPAIKHPSIAHVIPCPVVRCVGQNCFSTTRPYLPGVPVFNYRQDFNYPWSQAPSNLRPMTIAGRPSYQWIEVPREAPVLQPFQAPAAVPLDDPSALETDQRGEPEVVPAPPWESRRNSKAKPTVTTSRSGEVLVSDRLETAARRR